VQISEKN